MSTFDFVSQLILFVLGNTAIFLLAKKNRWGFVVGLVSQPFWFFTTAYHGQWLVFAMSFVYTGNWIYGIRNNFGQRVQQAEAHPEIASVDAFG